MAFDLNNFVIDRVVRGIATDMKTGDVLFSISQITNPSLNCASESVDAVDALNVPIATFYRAKNVEFSAENALFDMSLLAVQSGTTKKVASANAKIDTPCFQTIDIKASTTAYTLRHTPKTGTTPKVYVLKGDDTLGAKIDVVDSAYNRQVSISGKTITIGSSAKTYATATDYAVGDYVKYSSGTPAVEKTYKCKTAIASKDNAAWAADNWTEVTNSENLFATGEQLFVMYEYEADGAEAVKNSSGEITTNAKGAVEVSNTAKNFPVGCKFVMEILGADVCDQTNLIYAYLVFPNAKISPDFDWSIATDSTHPFSLKAMQDYCDSEKKLFSIIIPE